MAHREVQLLSQMEVFSNIESEIERAVQLGRDAELHSLDREINSLLDEILAYRAQSTDELMRQLKFITDLLMRRSEDGAAVMRLSSRLLETVGRFLADGQRAPEPEQTATVVAFRPSAEAAPARTDRCPEMARVAVISLGLCFLYCNAAMAMDLGVSPADLVGRPVGDFCDMLVFDEAYRLHLQMCLAGDFREFDAPWLMQGADGVLYHVRLTPLRDIDRHITGAIMVAQAVTPAKA
jgi:PAS domain-containing protein